MKSPIALIIGLTLGASLSLMHCGGGSTCTPDNCLGCCDTKGRCAPGTAATVCGAQGRACLPCPADAQCREGVCTIIIGGPGGGSAAGGTVTNGGTASTGGGSATGGGTAGGSSTAGGTSSTGGGSSAGGTACLQLPELTANPAGGAYLLRNNGTELVWTASATISFTPSGGTPEYITVAADLWHMVGAVPTFPVRGSVSSTATNRTCNQCFRIETTGCRSDGSGCTRQFFARGGSFEFLSGDTNMQMGRFTGNATGLRLFGWSFQNDTPVAGFGCIDVPRFTWNGDWP